MMTTVEDSIVPSWSEKEARRSRRASPTTTPTTPTPTTTTSSTTRPGSVTATPNVTPSSARVSGASTAFPPATAGVVGVGADYVAANQRIFNALGASSVSPPETPTLAAYPPTPTPTTPPAYGGVGGLSADDPEVRAKIDAFVAHATPEQMAAVVRRVITLRGVESENRALKANITAQQARLEAAQAVNDKLNNDVVKLKAVVVNLVRRCGPSKRKREVDDEMWGADLNNRTPDVEPTEHTTHTPPTTYNTGLSVVSESESDSGSGCGGGCVSECVADEPRAKRVRRKGPDCVQGGESGASGGLTVVV